ncbi:LytS/YhcK type 5TM receptor domain-containing protein [Pseudomonadota bacterium]
MTVPHTLFLDHIIPLLQHMLVFLGLAYLFTRTRVFSALVNNMLTWPDKLVIYVVFSSFCILGTFLSEQSFQSVDAIANTRAIGAVLGGLLGGPVVGLLVGATGGAHRILSMSSATDPVHYIDIACAAATTIDGLFAGCVHWFQSRRGRIESLFSQRLVWPVVLAGECGHILTILIAGWWVGDGGAAMSLQVEIAPPMIIANALGVALIIYMIREQKRSRDELGSITHAWAIANQCAGLLRGEFDQENSREIAQIIQRETRVAAVAITDLNRLLAFTGVGADHHLPGIPISSTATQKAIRKNRVVFSDGVNSHYQCHLDDDCALGSVLIIPLRDEANNTVLGTIKLYEVKHKLFRNINRRLGEDIAQLLSASLLVGRYQLQHRLRLQDQYQLLVAQVNPHFLYNALAAIGHITQQQPERARNLLQHLSDFFRKNLETSTDMGKLSDELAHVTSYLEIEKARFEERLTVSIDIPEHLLGYTVPVFTLQPIVENAIKHGVAEMIDGGYVKIQCVEDEDSFTLCVEDNAGLFAAKRRGGLGLRVDERIKTSFGEAFGISIACEAEQWTRVSIRLPKKE